MSDDEKIIPLPDKMQRRARTIKQLLEKQHADRAAWIADTVEIAGELAEARGDCRDDRAFGEWCEENGFGEDVINKNDRAAYVAMGADTMRFKAILQNCHRVSIQLIYRNEWMVPNVRNHRRKHVKSAKMETALAAVRAAQAAGERLDRNALAKQAGISDMPIRAAVNYQRGFDDGHAEGRAEAEATAAEDKLDRAQAHHVDAIVARLNREAKAQTEAWLAAFNARVEEKAAERTKEIQARNEELYAEYRRKCEVATEEQELLRQMMKPLFTLDQFKTIVRALHPDNSAGPETRAEAFRLVMARKRQLTGAK